MNKYNIKVGDYVETADGKVGYVTNIRASFFEWDEIIDGSYYVHIYSFEPEVPIKKFYKRIGANDFTKKRNLNQLNRLIILRFFQKIKSMN